MQYQRESIEAMIAGRKSQTRRPVQESDRYYLASDPGGRPRFVRYLRGCPAKGWDVDRVERVDSAGRWRTLFSVGSRRAICPGRGKKAVGHLVVKRIRLVPAERISDYDAKAEGLVWRPDLECWVANVLGEPWAGLTASSCFGKVISVPFTQRASPTKFLWAIHWDDWAIKWVPAHARFFGYPNQY